MFHVVLVEPEIPPNTGNFIRLCANTGAHLHLIEPLGFPLDDAKMRRAGLDYHEFATMQVHCSWSDFLEKTSPDPSRMFAFTTHGKNCFSTTGFMTGDFFVFGSETKGFSPEIHQFFQETHRIRLPMRPNNRSLNLSNSVAIVVYEAWRQNGFTGGM